MENRGEDDDHLETIEVESVNHKPYPFRKKLKKGPSFRRETVDLKEQRRSS